MSTPFAADNARKAAAPQYAAKQPDPWSVEVRLRLSALRRNAIARGDWRGPRFSLPEPCWRVTDAHSITQQKVYLALQAIGEGRHNRQKTGAAAAIKGQKNVSGKSYDYDVEASYSALTWIADLEWKSANPGSARNEPALNVRTVRDAVAQLARKHSIERRELRVRGDQTPSNRAPTFYRVPHWDAVLEARRADAAIATTHGNVNWSNGRANSRRLLTAEEASAWGLAALPERPKRTATDAKSAHAAPVGETAPEIPPSARSTAATGAGRGSGAGGRRSLFPEVPPDQQAQLDTLCGLLDTPPDRAGNRPPVFCDLAGQILANCQATAAAHGKEFRAEWLGEMCERFFEKRRKLVTSGAYKMWVWTADMPSAYMRDLALDEALVCRLIDNKGHQAKKDAARAEKQNREIWEKIASCLQQLRKSPNAVSVLQWSDELQRANPDLYIEVWREDDRRHGGDGEGASWDDTPLSIHKTPAKERTFADALAFGDPEEERPPPTESA